MTVKQKIEEGYLLGYINYKGKGDLYLMPIAYWILNYKKYDPKYNPQEWEFVFRDNILIVADEAIDKYLASIKIDKIKVSDFNRGNPINLAFFVDFDKKLFVSSFNEIEVEGYLPNEKWKGKFDNPIKYLPPGLLPDFGAKL